MGGKLGDESRLTKFHNYTDIPLTDRNKTRHSAAITIKTQLRADLTMETSGLDFFFK